jgi:type IV pilus assembly protein PilV
MHMPNHLKNQSGFMLLEALIAILIFSIGILGLVGLQANAINLSTDAKYRADAALLANQLIGRLAVADPAAAGTYSHRPSGSTVCAPTGRVSTSPVLTAWLAEVNASLPNADSTKQQVIVDQTKNVVNITICWQAPHSSQHRHTVTTQMQWQ